VMGGEEWGVKEDEESGGIGGKREEGNDLDGWGMGEKKERR